MSETQRNFARSTPPNAMSQEDWEALGPMGRVTDAGDVVFENAEADQDYAGNEDRQRATRPYHPHVFVTSGRHPLGNPNRTDDMNEYEAAHSLVAHYSRVLSRRDQSSVTLLADLARIANEKMSDGVDRVGRPNDASFREQIMDARNARTTAAGADMAEEAASAADRRIQGQGAGVFTVIAPTQVEAEIVRGMMDYALTVMPADTALKGQALIHKAADLPPEEEIRGALDKITPPLWGIVREDGRKAMALIVSNGMEDEAVRFMQTVPNTISVVPGRNRNLWSALIENDKTHYRLKVDFTQPGADGKYPRDALRLDNEKAINAADRAIIVWNGDDQDPAFAAAAYAARRGKLEAVIDQNGNTLDVDRAGEAAMKAHLTRAEWGRMRNASVFDIAANSPEGRFGLTLVRSSSGPAMSGPAIDALAATGMTINELCASAKDEQGAVELHKTHKIAGTVIRTLADDKVMANARSAYQRIIAHCNEHGVTIVGPEHFPQSLLKSGARLPAVLFLKGGSPEQLAAQQNIVAVLGDQNMLPHMAKKGSELVTALDVPHVTLLQVEKMGVPQYVPSMAGSILLLASGHGQYPLRPNLDWAVDENGIEKAKAKTGEYALIPAMDGNKMAVMYAAEGAAPVELFANFVPAKPAETPFDQMTEEMQKQARAYRNAIDDLKDVASGHEAQLINKPTRDFRDGIVAQGGMVVSLFPPIETSSVYSFATERREPQLSNRTPATEARTIEIAGRMADTTVINQLASDSPVAGVVAAAAEAGRKLVVVQPPAEVMNLDEVGGNLALTRVTGRELPMYLGNLRGERAHAVEKAFGTQKAATSTGAQIELAAQKIAERLVNPEADRKETRAKVANRAR